MGQHKNSKQEDALIAFMEKHSDIARGFTKGDKVDVENLWKCLVKDLNGLGPPIHDLSGWKRIWTNWKGGIKKKIAMNKKEVMATGGGPYNQMYISKREEVVGQICGLYAIVEGIQNTNTFGVDVSLSSSESSSDEDASNDQPRTSNSKPICGKRKRDENEKLDDNPGTSKQTPPSYKKRDDLKDHLKGYIASDIQHGKDLSDSLKMFSEICNNINEKLDVIGSNVRRVYKSVESLTTILTNELKRHHKEMENAAVEKNNLKKLDINIKEKQLELDQLKNKMNLI